MEATGIICEYNPLHQGHKKQLDAVKAAHPNDAIVCLMSGNYVQRGAPAIVDKSLRAQAAVLSGADLVLELPVTASLSSAEGFAGEGVRILSGFCQRLCFGAENADRDTLLATAGALLQPEFPNALHAQLDKGLSFPAARQAALETMGTRADILSAPNNILAVEYCKAILSQGLALEPMPIRREGNYHDTAVDPENPSATALRQLMGSGNDWADLVPECARACFTDAPLHTTAAAENAILYRLRTMTDEEFAALPYGSEGLWRKLMHNARVLPTLEDILNATKSKRYTRSRLDRMVMCAFLGITEKDIASPAPYVRVLAFNDTGRTILRSARESGLFYNTGEDTGVPYQDLEYRAGIVYHLFCQNGEPPYDERSRRVYYKTGEHT